MTVAECVLHFNRTTDMPHLVVTRELRGVYCEDFGEKWLRYNGTALYFIKFVMQKYQNGKLVGTMIPRHDYV